MYIGPKYRSPVLVYIYISIKMEPIQVHVCTCTCFESVSGECRNLSRSTLYKLLNVATVLLYLILFVHIAHFNDLGYFVLHRSSLTGNRLEVTKQSNLVTYTYSVMLRSHLLLILSSILLLHSNVEFVW